MITSSGRDLLRLHLASSGLYGSIALGIGSSEPTTSDTRLEFEIARLPVGYTAFDFEGGRVILRASVSPTVAGKVSEVALVPGSAVGVDSSRLILSFGSDTELWTEGVFTDENVRIGDEALRLSINNDTLVAESAMELSLSNYSDQDTFALAFHSEGNVDNIVLTLGTDTSNHYSSTVTPLGGGHHIARWSKGSMVVTGSPSWDDINYVSVAVTSSGGTGTVDFDGFRVDKEASTAERFIISRNLIDEVHIPFGSTADFETSLGVNFED